MRRRDLGIALCFATVSVCLLLHIASFLGAVPFLLILAPIPLLAGAIICATPNPMRGWHNPPPPKGRTAVVGWILLVYSVALFVHFYMSSEGASSVGIVDGRYVYMYQSTVIRAITEKEYKMFPAQVAKIMSAWIAMMATFCMSSLFNSQAEAAN